MPQQHHYFVALYSGESISSARIISASVNPELVQSAIDKMLPELERVPETNPIQSTCKRRRLRSLRQARETVE